MDVKQAVDWTCKRFAELGEAAIWRGEDIVVVSSKDMLLKIQFKDDGRVKVVATPLASVFVDEEPVMVSVETDFAYGKYLQFEPTDEFLEKVFDMGDRAQKILGALKSTFKVEEHEVSPEAE